MVWCLFDVKWTNAELLLVGLSSSNEIWIEIWKSSFEKKTWGSVICRMTAILYRPQCANWFVFCYFIVDCAQKICYMIANLTNFYVSQEGPSAKLGNFMSVLWTISYGQSYQYRPSGTDSHTWITWMRSIWIFLASTKQLYEWFSPSVRLSVHHTFLTMFPSSYHHKIFMSYYQWQKWRPWKKVKVRGQRSRSQRSQPNLTVSGL